MCFCALELYVPRRFVKRFLGGFFVGKMLKRLGMFVGVFAIMIITYICIINNLKRL